MVKDVLFVIGFIIVVVYAGTAFITLHFNPANWSQEARIIDVVVMVCLLFALAKSIDKIKV